MIVPPHRNPSPSSKNYLESKTTRSRPAWYEKTWSPFSVSIFVFLFPATSLQQNIRPRLLILSLLSPIRSVLVPWDKWAAVYPQVLSGAVKETVSMQVNAVMHWAQPRPEPQRTFCAMVQDRCYFTQSHCFDVRSHSLDPQRFSVETPMLCWRR